MCCSMRDMMRIEAFRAVELRSGLCCLIGIAFRGEELNLGVGWKLREH